MSAWATALRVNSASSGSIAKHHICAQLRSYDGAAIPF
jgi:hypothetical protein